MLDQTGLAIKSPNPRTLDVYDWALSVLQMYAGKMLSYTDSRRDLENDRILFRSEPSQDMKRFLADCLGYQYSDLTRAEELCRKEMTLEPEPAAPSEPADRRTGLLAWIRARRKY